MASKISYIYDYTECAQTASKITEDSMLIHAFTQCATTFINDYYDNTVKDYSNCTGAELLGIKKMDQYYTTYTNCIGGVKTDYTVDMAGAFAEVTQCHADFITSFNSMF